MQGEYCFWASNALLWHCSSRRGKLAVEEISYPSPYARHSRFLLASQPPGLAPGSPHGKGGRTWRAAGSIHFSVRWQQNVPDHLEDLCLHVTIQVIRTRSKTCMKRTSYRPQPRTGTSPVCNGKSEELGAKFGFVCTIIWSNWNVILF